MRMLDMQLALITNALVQTTGREDTFAMDQPLRQLNMSHLTVTTLALDHPLRRLVKQGHTVISCGKRRVYPVRKDLTAKKSQQLCRKYAQGVIIVQVCKPFACMHGEVLLL